MDSESRNVASTSGHPSSRGDRDSVSDSFTMVDINNEHSSSERAVKISRRHLHVRFGPVETSARDATDAHHASDSELHDSVAGEKPNRFVVVNTAASSSSPTPSPTKHDSWDSEVLVNESRSTSPASFVSLDSSTTRRSPSPSLSNFEPPITAIPARPVKIERKGTGWGVPRPVGRATGNGEQKANPTRVSANVSAEGTASATSDHGTDEETAIGSGSPTSSPSPPSNDQEFPKASRVLGATRKEQVNAFFLGTALVRAPDKIKEERRAREEFGIFDTAYERKLMAINEAIEECGFGKFQSGLFALAGLGWLVDNLWFEALALILPQIQLEWRPAHVQYSNMALYGGLVVGAAFWGLTADFIGRKVSFSLTLLLSSIFGVLVSVATNFNGFSVIIFFLGIAVGGNLPVDGALFLEFLPASKQWSLVFLSTWWSLGALVSALVAWPFMENFSCMQSDQSCSPKDNLGWRFTFMTLGLLTLLIWIARFWLFPIPESPKFLVGKGRDSEAVEVIATVARQNGTKTSLTLKKMQKVAGDEWLIVDSEDKLHAHEDEDAASPKSPSGTAPEMAFDEAVDSAPISKMEILKRSLSTFSFAHFKGLFGTTRMAVNTTLLFVIWALIGLAYPLYNAFILIYLQKLGDDNGNGRLKAYWQYVIITIASLPGSFIASYLVETRSFGRKGTLALFTGCTSIFFFLFTIARTPTTIVVFNCLSAFAQQGMYGVLYAMTFEALPTRHRGTGEGVAMAINRIMGMMASLISTKAGLDPTTPVYISASVIMAAAFLAVLLPYDGRGKPAL